MDMDKELSDVDEEEMKQIFNNINEFKQGKNSSKSNKNSAIIAEHSSDSSNSPRDYAK